MAHKFLFVGERPSLRAAEIGATWENGGLAARTLHDALRAHQIEPAAQQYTNLWQQPGKGWGTGAEAHATAQRVQTEAEAHGLTVVALGRRVHRALALAGVPHLEMVHPAARGKIRKREVYQAHVGTVLGVVQ